MIIAVPLLINIIAIFIWFLHWHGYWKPLNLKVFSFSLMALSFFLWFKIKGPEFGFIYFSISTSIIGLLYLVESKYSFKNLIKFRKHNPSENRQHRSKETLTVSDYMNIRIQPTQFISLLLKSIANFLLMIIVPFLAAASISLLLPTIFGIKDVNILVSSLFIFLISWSLLLTWVYMKSKKNLALCLLLLVSIFTLTTVYISVNHISDISNIKL